MKKLAMATCTALLLLASIFTFGLNPAPAKAAATVSYVDTSKATYDKYTMMVDDKPFYHSGVQLRYDMLKNNSGWTDNEIKSVLQMISDDGFNVVNIPVWWSMVEPAKDAFDWSDVNKMIDWCKEYNLKLEILWFSHESTGITIAQRVPSYVMNDYQFVLKSDGTRLTKNGNYLLDKTDPNLLSREKYVLGQLMSHLAAYDTGHTVVGMQVTNEPNAANMQWGASSDRSYSTYSTTRWNNGGYTDAGQFRKDVLLDYVNQLAQVIKQSDYSVYTRVNTVGDAKPVTENENLKTQGLSYVDMIGNDPYTTNNDSIYNYGSDSFWAKGKNLPMIMENFAGNSTVDINKFNAVAGNTVFNLYAAVDNYASTGSSDHGLYNFNPTTHAVTRKTVSNKVANLNHMLSKISRDLATKAPIERGGSKLQTFNRGAAASVTGLTKPLDNLNVTFTTSSGGQGIAVKRSASEIALLSTQATTYTLPGSYGTVGSISTGYYDSNDAWVSTGTTTYDTSTGNIVINLNAGECVRVLFSNVGNTSSIVSGATYKIKNAASGKYVDSDANGAVILAASTTYDDQDWIVSKEASGYWSIKNARTGRYYLNTDLDSVVSWNTGGTIYDDALWSLEEVASGGFRIKNHVSGRDYLFATSANELNWNTGATDSSTIWIFEKK